MKYTGFHVSRFGLYFFGRNAWKYRQFYVVPGVAVEMVRGRDYYIDVEIKLLCFGFGVRFIWLKNRRNPVFFLSLALLMMAASLTATSCEKETTQFYNMTEEVNMLRTTFVSVAEGELIKANAERFKCCLLSYTVRPDGNVILTAGGTESNLDALFEFAKKEVEKLNQSEDGQ